MRAWTAILASTLLLPSCTSHLRADRPPAATPQRGTPGSAGIGVVGLSLGRTSHGTERPALIVDGTVPEGPAARAGIRPGDQITAIDGAPTVGMPVGEAARLIRGPAETSVTLALRTRAGARTVTLMRVSLESLGSVRATPASSQHRPGGNIKPSGSVPAKGAPTPPIKRR